MDRLPVFELLINAGPVVKGVLLLLALASIASWAIAFEKLVRIVAFSRQVSRLGKGSPLLADPQSWLAARLHAVADSEPAANGESRSEFNARLERSLQIEAGAHLQRLQAGLPFLATVGSTAPFVGLFGTVWGIMHSFSGIAAAKDTSLATVAPGIAEALFATAVGLAAAIPAVLFYNQANVALGRIAARLSAAVVQLAKDRAYAPSQSREGDFANGFPVEHVERGLTNGDLAAR
ncbi:MAG: MotA/TolQ/ExbB proton channel family protein [Rhodomicrobium sp.]